MYDCTCARCRGEGPVEDRDYAYDGPEHRRDLRAAGFASADDEEEWQQWIEAVVDDADLRPGTYTDFYTQEDM